MLVDLRATLKRLRLAPTAHVAFSSRSTHRSLGIDAYLTQLIRQGYIDRTRIGENKGAGAGGKKRGRGPAPTQADDQGTTWEWRWGNRAASEVGEQAIARFVAEFMVERTRDGDGEDDEGGQAAGQRALEEANKKVEKMIKGITRAAGGELADVK